MPAPTRATTRTLTRTAVSAIALAGLTCLAAPAMAYDVPPDWTDPSEEVDGLQVVGSQEWCQDGTVPQVMLKVTSSRSDSFSVGRLGSGRLDGPSAVGLMYPTVSYDDAPLHESATGTLLMVEWAIGYDAHPSPVAVLNVPHAMSCEGLPTTPEAARAALDARPAQALTLWVQGGEQWFDVDGELHRTSGAVPTTPPALPSVGDDPVPAGAESEASGQPVPGPEACCGDEGPASGPRIQTGTTEPSSTFGSALVLGAVALVSAGVAGTALARRH